MIALAQLPFVAMFFGDLYRDKPHYEFAPLVMVSALAFLWVRWPDTPFAWGRGEQFTCFAMLGLSLLGFAGATALVSPWLAMVSFLLAIASWGIWNVGRLGVSSLMSVWLLLWVMIPPPLQLDSRVIITLQSITSRCTAVLLDLVRVPYLRNGNVFEIENRSLFVAEACSGVHSQLVLIAVSAILCLGLRRPAVHTLLLIVAAIFWSIAANIARVFIVVVAESRGTTLGEGWRHEALGCAVVMTGLLLVYSTDRLIHFVLAPIDDQWIGENLITDADADDMIERSDLLKMEIDSRFCRAWNRLTSGDDKLWGGYRDPNARPGPRSIGPFAVAFALLAIVGFLPGPLARSAGRVDDASELYARLDEDLLPETIGDFHRQSHSQEQRDRSSPQGMYSHHWQYASTTEAVAYSMDFPFSGWHELTLCYFLNGWQVASRTHLPGANADPYVEVELKRGQNEFGVLHFVVYGSDKRPLKFDISAKARLVARFDANPLLRRVRGLESLAIDPPTYQFQQFTRTPQPPTQSELDHLRSLFLATRDLWLQSDAFEGR